MIRLAGPADEDEIIALAAAWPATGAIVEMYWRLQQENPRLPHRFYLAGGAVLRVGGSRATLCGRVADPEEVAAFLHLEGVSQMTASDFYPTGWRLLETNKTLLRLPAPYAAPAPLPHGLEAWPDMEAVMAVLESRDGRMTPPAAREFFYADANARRNHGAAVVLGIREGDALAATAGAWAVTAREAYIACVETRAEAQGRGYATALLGLLCAQLGGRAMSLMCRSEMQPFYARFGFAAVPVLGCISIDPKRVMPASRGSG